MYRSSTLVLAAVLILTCCRPVFAKTDDSPLSGQPRKKPFHDSMAAPGTPDLPALRSTLTGFVPKQPPLTGFVPASTLPARVKAAPSAAPKPAAAPDSCKYALATEDTPNRKELCDLQKKVQHAGIHPVVLSEVKPVTVYRLLSSCRDDLPGATRDLARIASRIGTPFIIRNNGSYCVVAASLFSEATARAGQKMLRRKGIKTRIETFLVPLPVQRITVGPMTERREAEAVRKMLSTRGVSMSVETTVN